MPVSKKLSALGVALLIAATIACRASATTFYYWDPNGTTFSSAPGGSWDSASWATAATGQATPVSFVSGGLVSFSAGTASTGAFTVTENTGYTIAGIFNGGLSSSAYGGSVTINGTGALTLSSGLQGFDTASSTNNTIINVPIAGAGGVENQGSGSLYLYGNNTYTGGTALDTAAGLNFDNNNSFGTGAITWTAATTVLATPAGAATAPITINNPVTTVSGTQIFVGNSAAPVTWKGAWTLPSSGNSTFENLTAGVTTTIAGAIGGKASLVLNGAGTTILSGANTFTNFISVAGGTVVLGSAGTISTTKKVVLNGGTLNPDGLNQNISGATLSVSNNSTMDFGVGGSTVIFASSAGLTWHGILDLTNWNPTIDTLQFGTSSSGLTAGQLGDIEFNGTGEGTAQLNSSGDVVPEPSSMLLGMLGGLGLLVVARRVKQ